LRENFLLCIIASKRSKNAKGGCAPESTEGCEMSENDSKRKIDSKIEAMNRRHKKHRIIAAVLIFIVI
jgi:hypothetical protein